MARACSTLLELCQVAAIPDPGGKRNIASCERSCRQYRFRKGSDLLRTLVAVQVVAEHYRTAFDRLGELPVIVERGPKFLVDLRKPLNRLQFVARELVKLLDTGAVVGLRENHVKSNDRDLILVEQLGDQPGHDVARPWPARDFLQALFVDIENDDTLVHSAGHRQAESRVVDDVVQLGHDAHLVKLRGVPEKYQNYRQTAGDPDDVLLHVTLRAA